MLLTEIPKDNILENVDRYCILLTGKPNYVGTDYWCEHTVGALRKDIESLGKPVDIISIIWKTDPAFGGNPVSTITGFLPISETHHQVWTDFVAVRDQLWDYQFEKQDDYIGKIPVKNELEQYLREQFDFADTFTAYYVDLYDIINRLRKEYNDDNIKNPGWQSQFYQLTEAYRLNPNMFDRYTQNSFILKLRYDNHFAVQSDLFGLEDNQWYPIIKYFASELHEHKFKLHPTELEIAARYPNILIENSFKHTGPPTFKNNSIIGGKQFWVSDLLFGFDGPGIKTFTENYEKWAKQDTNGYNRNFIKNENNSNIHPTPGYMMPEFTPHRHLTEFFFDYRYNIHFTPLSSRHILRDVDRLRPGDYDNHRQRWYNYTQEQIENLTKIYESIK